MGRNPIYKTETKIVRKSDKRVNPILGNVTFQGTMRTSLLDDRTLDLCAFVGVLLGMGLLIPSFLLPSLSALTVPSFAILLPSLLFAAR